MPSIAVSANDRTMPLIDGRIPLGTLNWEFVSGPIESIFSRAFADAPYELTEISLSNQLRALSLGNARYRALPIATSRMFRHSAIYVDKRADIRHPSDLHGKRVGLREFTNTASLVARGVLDDEYGVQCDEIHWVVGDIEQVERDVIPTPHIEGVRIETVVGTSLVELLDRAEISAILSYQALDNCSSNIRRLFSDYPAVERDYFRRTGIFPIMHLLAVRSDAAETIGCDELVNIATSFRRAKELSYRDLRDQQALHVMLPWGPSAAQEAVNLMGDDYWAYGLSNLRAALSAELRWAHRQGITAERFDADQVVWTWPELEEALRPGVATSRRS